MYFNTDKFGLVHVGFEYDFPYSTAATLSVKKGDDWEVVDTAYVSRWHTDTWNKKVGRKHAFDKLVKTNFDRTDRTIAWKEFLLNCKLP